ncbi:unnamed protein product [Mesocestoides corti]|uniref:Dol-P-Glc:Glc(2)Man(9)GlcNAc(2)-PP-Dol alpha-1,2-glucosyltransferase n=1 Tax=Mesocestoides corti TaxID=53468 RepID=A0A0R3U1X9_MESCO|nr:unnamed protein product [Mesocestoides corti]
MVNHTTAIAVAIVYSLVLCGVVHYLVNAEQPKAYMDEIFHEEQTLTYLGGHWYYWNPKITTPPGLYVITTLIWQVLSLPPSVVYFRFLNCVIAGVNLLLLAELTQSTLAALAISTLPVLSFTALLFYTDQLSLCALLVTLLAQRSSKPWLAFLSGGFACFVRQTNIIWLGFMIGERAVSRLAPTEAGRRDPLAWCCYLLRHPRLLFNALFRAAFCDAPHYTALCFMFVTFVVLFNDGDIVLGDRSAHRPVLHIPQLFYFFVFCALSTPCSFLRYLSTLRIPQRLPTLCIHLILLLIALAVRYFTFEHSYLLADNRHYTFYMWSRLFRRYHSFRYLVVPFYLLTGSYVCWGFGVRRRLDEFLITLGFLICASAALVPAELIEPRYFVTPYVVWRLVNIPEDNRKHHLVDILLNILINVITVYVFIFLPFRWLSQPLTWQRFMW